jgi:hypothetical protein
MAIGPNVVSRRPGFWKEVEELDRLFSRALLLRSTRDARYNLPHSVLPTDVFVELRERFTLLGWEEVLLLPNEDPGTVEVVFRAPRTSWERFNISIAPHFDRMYGDLSIQ